MLRIYNTLHRRVEDFVPAHPPQVGMYTCGPTVYNPLQLGNWRKYAFDDTLHRVMIFLGYQVKHITNITDVGHLVSDADEGEDKLEREAERTGKNAFEIARHYERTFVDGMKQLNMLSPDVMPRATEHIAEQIELVKRLEKLGFTYQTSDGIYFDTAKLPSYGSLSGQKLADKAAGARVAVNVEKKHTTDFALWKFSSTTEKRQMEWPSPWGIGFPGWHIECSAMSVKYLGQPFDIHAGGVDLIAVHHENEIAQTEAATGQPLANYWVHNEFLLVDGRRMGKSEGNAYTLDDVMAKGFDPLAYRYFCLNAHYRSKLNFTWEGLTGAAHALRNLYAACRELKAGAAVDDAIMQRFRSALEDDVNTPQALAVMWELVKCNACAEMKGAMLLKMDEVLGLRLGEHIGRVQEIPCDVQRLAEERQQARAQQDWTRSDALRRDIEALGWHIEDLADGGWEVVRG